MALTDCRTQGASVPTGTGDTGGQSAEDPVHPAQRQVEQFGGHATLADINADQVGPSTDRTKPGDRPPPSEHRSPITDPYVFYAISPLNVTLKVES